MSFPSERAEEHPAILRGTEPRRKRSVPPRRVLAAAGAILLGLVLVLLPRLLMVSRLTPARADAIYVFPGQVPERALCAADLYREGRAPVVVFSGAHVAPELLVIDQPLSDAALNAQVARQNGVPAADEVILAEGTSTWEDAFALGGWMRSSGAREVIAVTSPIHSRRALWSIRMALGGLASEVTVYPCGTVYGADWWARERSLVRVTEEVLKLGFYAVRHFLPAALGLGGSAPATRDDP